jgi:hypothetical protein
MKAFRKASDRETSLIKSSLDKSSELLLDGSDHTAMSGTGSRTNSRLFSVNKAYKMSKEEFMQLDPATEIEIAVVRPVKKIVALLSHVEYLFELKLKGGLYKYKVNKRFRDFDSLNQVVSL